MRKLFIALVILTVGALAAWFAMLRSIHPATIEVVAPVVCSLETSFAAEAFVRAKTYAISAEAPGRIARIAVLEGQQVGLRQPLVWIDDAEASREVARAERAAETVQEAAVEALRVYEARRAQTVAAQERAQAMVKVAEANLRDRARGVRPEAIEQAEHDLEGLRAATEVAERQLQRSEKLFAEGALSLSSLEKARAASRSARAAQSAAEDALLLLKAGPLPEESDAARESLRAARAELRLAMAGSLELGVLKSQIDVARARVAEAVEGVRLARIALDKTCLRSPVAGTVVKLYAEVGSYASPGAPLLRIASREDLHVEAELRSEDVGAVAMGDRVRIFLPSLPNRPIAGEVERLAPEAEPKPDAALRTRIVRCRIRVEGESGQLVPGIEVDVEFRTKSAPVPTVPNDSVSLEGPSPTVWTVQEGRLVRRTVRIGASDGRRTEIRQGLGETDRVVFSPSANLREGDKVRPIEQSRFDH